MNWIFLQTLRGSFSAVSTPIFAIKYSLESSWRDLQDLHTFAPLRSQISANRQHFFANGYYIIMNFRFCHFLCRNLHFSANFWWNFVRISRQIPEKRDVCRFFNRICENKINKLENNYCRTFWNLWKLFIIIQSNFLFFNRPLFLNLLFK